MKKLLLIPLLLLTVLSMAACGGGDDEPFRPGQPETPDVSSLNVNITVGDRTVTATMEDNAAAFTKAQLVASQRYVHRRDLIGALLEDGKTYTLNEVDALIEKFVKGKVR